jgi:hypothetical protein
MRLAFDNIMKLLLRRFRFYRKYLFIKLINIFILTGTALIHNLDVFRHIWTRVTRFWTCVECTLTLLLADFHHRLQKRMLTKSGE